MKLEFKLKVSDDSYIFRFAFDNPDQTLGIACGHHVGFTAMIDGERITRPYTPISSMSQRGSADFCVKVY